MRAVTKPLKTIDDYIFSHIGKTKILFVVKNAYGWACQKPIYDAISRIDKKNQFTLVTCIDGEDFSINDGSIKDCLYKNLININDAAWKKWHYIIHTDINSPYFHRNAVNIMMPHGTGFGNVEKNYNQIQYTSSLCDIYFGLSINEYKYIKSSLKPSTVTRNKLFIPIGSPKSDVLFTSTDDTLHSGSITKKIDNNKKTILVWSHWTDTSLLSAMKPDFIQAIIEKHHKKYNFIVTGHALLWTEHSDKKSNPSLWADLKKIEHSYSNVFVTRYVADLHPLIQISDIFISDHSSFTIECSTKNNPILFYDDPLRTFNSESVLNAYRDACYSFCNTKEALAHLEDITNGEDNKQKERLKFKNIFYSNHGHAADFAATTILKLGKLPPSKPNKWKLIAKTKGISFFS
jgi:hypothetical protein